MLCYLYHWMGEILLIVTTRGGGRKLCNLVHIKETWRFVKIITISAGFQITLYLRSRERTPSHYLLKASVFYNWVAKKKWNEYAFVPSQITLSLYNLSHFTAVKHKSYYKFWMIRDPYIAPNHLASRGFAPGPQQGTSAVPCTPRQMRKAYDKTNVPSNVQNKLSPLQRSTNVTRLHHYSIYNILTHFMHI